MGRWRGWEVEEEKQTSNQCMVASRALLPKLTLLVLYHLRKVQTELAVAPAGHPGSCDMAKNKDARRTTGDQSEGELDHDCRHYIVGVSSNSIGDIPQCTGPLGRCLQEWRKREAL